MRVFVNSLALVLWLSVVQTGDCRFNFRMGGKPVCQPVQNSLCSLLYNSTSVPNFRNHPTQEHAENELNQYLGLIELGCSNVLLHLLCAVYVPFCSYDYPEIRLPPCLDMCEHARDGCEHVLHAYGLPWPEHLECSQYPNKTQSLCFGPKVDPSSVPMPALENLPTSISTNGPQALEIIGLEPHLVTFYWEPPPVVSEEANYTSFNYLLSCDPQPYGFPYELSRLRGPVDVTLSGFMPSTKYICSVFDTRFVTEESAAMIEFTTPDDDSGSTFPENFRAKVLGPQDVLFMWSPPAADNGSTQAPPSYILSCQPQPNGFPVEFHEGHVPGPIEDSYGAFQPDTMYNCGVYDSVAQQEFAVTTTFATFERLALRFVRDTPLIEQGYIHLEFELNRPVVEATCQLLRSSRSKENCTNGVVSYFGLDPGVYTIRIVAENNRFDRFRERMKFTVPRESECIVHLFNNRLTQNGTNVTVEFRSTGSLISGFRCRLDEDDFFQCVSPLHLERLERGPHQLEISPLGIGSSCRRERPLALSFQV